MFDVHFNGGESLTAVNDLRLKGLIARESDTVIEPRFQPFIINYTRVTAASHPIAIDDSKKRRNFSTMRSVISQTSEQSSRTPEGCLIESGDDFPK